ncbi:MAG: PH domain-containing protein [Propionibacteriaceae bacterium]|jgi:putative membrane protein|nr:PH domain-containing protein [Propionibacteriaceae bacterium]
MTAEPVDPRPAATPDLAEDSAPWQRLHPLTPWLRNWAGLLVLVGFVINSARNNLTELIEVGQAAGVWRLVIIALVLVSAMVCYNLIWWRRARFRIGAESIELISGIVYRQHRRLRLDHLEAIDVVHPLVPRLFGLAEVKVETAGGDDSHLSLAYLTASQAATVRADIAARRPSAPVSTGHQSVAQTSRQAMNDVWQMVRPGQHSTESTSAQHTAPALAVPPLVSPTLNGLSGPTSVGGWGDLTGGTTGPDPSTAGRLTDPPGATLQPDPPDTTPLPDPSTNPTAGQLALDPSSLPTLFTVPTTWTVTSYLRTWEPWFTLAATIAVSVVTLGTRQWGSLLAYLPILAGFGRALWNHLVTEMGFTARTTPDGIRLTHGLTTQINQSIPARRIQAIRLSQRLWWRGPNWWRITCNIAGYGMTARSADRTLLVPVADPAMAARAIGAVMPEVTSASVWPLIEEAMTYPGPKQADADADAGFVTTPRRARWFSPLVWARQGYARTPSAIVIRSGWWTRKVTIVPHDRIQAITTNTGWWDRRQRLVEIVLHSTAGPIAPRIADLDRDDAAQFIAAQTPLIDHPGR